MYDVFDPNFSEYELQRKIKKAFIAFKYTVKNF